MVTNYSHSIASHSALTTPEAGGLREHLMDRVRQFLCGLHGHDTLLHYEQERLSLQCVSCGHETPGWQLNEVPPTVTVRGDVRRHRVARPQLIRAISDRRIA